MLKSHCTPVLIISLFIILIIPFSGFAEPGALRIVTARDVGLPSDIVRACVEVTGRKFKIQKITWARAYHWATTEKNILIYALSFNEVRKPLFEWVGPIVSLNHVLSQIKDRYSNQHLRGCKKI